MTMIVHFSLFLLIDTLFKPQREIHRNSQISHYTFNTLASYWRLSESGQAPQQCV